MTALLSVLWERRVVQILGLYVVGGWGVVDFVDWLAGRYGLTPAWANTAFLVLVVLLPSVVLTAWYHGRPAHQQIERVEQVVVPINLTLAIGLAWMFFGGSSEEAGPAERRQLTFLGNASTPVWSPDGQQLAFVATDSIGRAILRVHLEDPTQVDTLYATQELVDRPRWTPGGVVFWNGRNTLSASPEGDGVRVLNGWPYWGASFDGSWVVQANQDSKELTLEGRRDGRAERVTISLPDSDEESFLHGLRWSSGGHVLAVVRSLATGFRIDLVTPEGRTWNAVAGAASIGSVHWSGDGSSLFFTRDGVLESVAIERDTGEPLGEPITLMQDVTGGAAVSPDGKDVIVTQSTPRSTILWRRIGDTQAEPLREALLLGTSASRRWNLSVSPDGSAVAYGDAAHEDALVVERLDGSGREVIPLGVRPARSDWHPSGDEIALLSAAPEMLIRVSVEAGSVPDTVETGVGQNLTWCSEEGLLYQIRGNHDYRLSDVVAGSERLLLGEHSKGWMFRPVCSPGADEVAFFYNHLEGGVGLWVVSMSGEEERQLVPTSGRDSAYPLAWSPDGDWIYYRTGATPPAGVHRVPAAGGPSELVVEFPFNTTSIDMSHDASTLVTIETESISDLWITTNFRSGN